MRPHVRRLLTPGLLILAFLCASCRVPSESGEPMGSDTAGSIGMEVFSVDSPSPMITIKLLFRAGSTSDPPGREGLAALTARSLLEGGFGDREDPVTKEELAEIVLPWGGGALPRVQVASETTTFHFTVPSDVLSTYVEKVLRPMLSRPLFLPGEIDRLKKELAANISRVRLENLETLGLTALDEYIFEGTRYAHPTFGCEATLPDLSRDDILDFFRSHYRRNRVIVGLSSSEPAIREVVDSALGALPSGVEPVFEGEPVLDPPPIDGRHAVVIEEPNAPAASLHLGFPLEIDRSDPDFWPLYVANVWFGTHRDSFSHLYQLIRRERGYNYGDYSYIEHWNGRPASLFPIFTQPRLRQYFSIWIRPVQHEYACHILKAATWELERLVEDGLTDEQVAAAKTKARSLYLNLAENVDRLVGAGVDSLYYGMEKGFLESYVESIDGVTPDAVNAAVKKHLQTENIKYLAVTDADHAAKLVEELRQDRPVYGKSLEDYELERVTLDDGVEVWQIPAEKVEMLRRDALWAHCPLDIRSVRLAPVTALFKTGAFLEE